MPLSDERMMGAIRQRFEHQPVPGHDDPIASGRSMSKLQKRWDIEAVMATAFTITAHQPPSGTDHAPR